MGVVYRAEGTLHSIVYSLTLFISTSTEGTRCDAKESDINQQTIFQRLIIIVVIGHFYGFVVV